MTFKNRGKVRKRKGRRKPASTSMLAHTVPRSFQQPRGELDTTRKWYAVMGRVRRGKAARAHLAYMGCWIYRPIVWEARSVGPSAYKVSARDALPRYFFAAKPPEVTFHDIKEAIGVAGFVELGSTPVPVQPKHIQVVIDNLSREDPVPAVSHLPQPGETVRVTEGPFSGFEGPVEACHVSGVLRIGLTVFGRENPVMIEHSQVERVARSAAR